RRVVSVRGTARGEAVAGPAYRGSRAVAECGVPAASAWFRSPPSAAPQGPLSRDRPGRGAFVGYRPRKGTAANATIARLIRLSASIRFPFGKLMASQPAAYTVE